MDVSGPSKPKGGRKKRNDPTIKRRTTRACDQCRKTKSRCEMSVEGGPCNSCMELEVECTLSGPSLRRGPPKGYLHTVETCLHEVEAVLGILLSLPDERAVSLLSDISQDSFARDVIRRVNQSPFGLIGREQQTATDQTTPSIATRSRRKKEINPYVTGPTNAWQDQVIMHILSSQTTGETTSSYGTLVSPLSSSGDGPPVMTSPRQLPTTFDHTREAPDSPTYDDEFSESDDGIQAMGQLAVGEHNQVQFHGKSSGLPLLDQSERTDDTRSVWYLGDNYPESQTEVHDSDIDMPALNIQEYLLELYFNYFHPSFPLVDKMQVLQSFSASKQRGSRSEHDSCHTSKLLLLSIFSIAARYAIHLTSSVSSNDVGKSKAGGKFFTQAKILLNRTYHISHPEACQALLLLAGHEFGVGALAQAWLYTGMAIRMAQDLGMHLSANRWTKKDGKSLFNDNETLVRKRVWYGCVKQDKYISMYMGRPVAIHEKQFDIPLPEELNGQEFDIWQPHPSRAQTGCYTPIPGRLLSRANADTALALIVCRVLERLYTVLNGDQITTQWTEANHLKKQLDHWMQDLPDHLQLRTPQDVLAAPPHIITLHMQWECAVILIYRRFIRISRNANMHESSLSSLALDQSREAADHVYNLVTAYRANFTLKNAAPFDAYDIFYAGTIFIASATIHPLDEQSVKHLDDCLLWLQEIQGTWSCAERCYNLLRGAKLPRSHSQSGHGTEVGDPNAPFASYDSSMDFSGDDVELYPSSYASRLLFQDVAGGVVDPYLLNGYMWNASDIHAPYTEYNTQFTMFQPTGMFGDQQFSNQDAFTTALFGTSRVAQPGNSASEVLLTSRVPDFESSVPG